MSEYKPPDIPQSPLLKRRLSASNSGSNTSFFSLPSLPLSLSNILNIRYFSGATQDPVQDAKASQESEPELLLGEPLALAQEGDLQIHEAATDTLAFHEQVNATNGSYTPLPSPLNERPRLSISTRMNTSRKASDGPMSPVSRDPVTQHASARVASSDSGSPVRNRQPSAWSIDSVAQSDRARTVSIASNQRQSLPRVPSMPYESAKPSPPVSTTNLPETSTPKQQRPTSGTEQSQQETPSSRSNSPTRLKKPFLHRLGIKRASMPSPPSRSVSLAASESSKRASTISVEMARSDTNDLEASQSRSQSLDILPQITRTTSTSSIASNSTAKTNESTSRKPRVIRTKYKNKTERDFKHLFLAQTLSIETLPFPSTPSSVVLTDSSPPSSNGDSDQQSSIFETAASNRPSHKKPAIWTMEFSRCGRYLAAAGHDAVVRVWTMHSNTKDDSDDLDEHQSSARRMSVSEDGHSVLSHGTSASCRKRSRAFSSVQLAPVFDEKPLWEYVGHTSDVLDLSWSKNTFLLSSSMDKTVRLWHISRRECLAVYQHSDFVTSIAFHPRDDRYFLSGSLDCRLRLWCVPEKNLTAWSEVDQLITAVAFSTDGKTSMAGTYMGQCAFFKTDGLKYMNTLLAASSRGRNSKGSKITGLRSIRTSSERHDRLLVTTNDSRIRMYNLIDNGLEAKFSGHENASSQIRASMSDDGRFVICGGEDGSVHLWDSGVVEKREANGWLLNKKGKPGYECLWISPDIVTCCVIAPSGTKEILKQNHDILFTLQQKPTNQISPLKSRSVSRPSIAHQPSKVSTISNMSVEGWEEAELDLKERQSTIDDCIMVAADQEGHIRVFRNSKYPDLYPDESLKKRNITLTQSRLREASLPV